MSTSYELIIFDCDGVLIDSEKLSADVLISALADLNIQIDFNYFAQHFIGRSFPTVAQIIRETFNITLPDDFERNYRARLLRVFEKQLQPTVGVKQVLQSLNRPICVATSSSPERVSRSLALTGLSRFFGSHVFTASEVACGKPAPDLFFHAAGKMEIAPDTCLVVEDSLPGVTAAIAAGMTVFRYTGGAHLKDSPDVKTDLDPSVPIFDNWDSFFQLAPALRPVS